LVVNKELQIDGDGRMARGRGAAGAEDGNARKTGKAMAMVGWGHLSLPFYAAAKWRCVSVSPRTCGGGELGRVMPSR